jgi:hypothetical protein
MAGVEPRRAVGALQSEVARAEEGVEQGCGRTQGFEGNERVCSSLPLLSSLPLTVFSTGTSMYSPQKTPLFARNWLLSPLNPVLRTPRKGSNINNTLTTSRLRLFGYQGRVRSEKQGGLPTGSPLFPAFSCFSISTPSAVLNFEHLRNSLLQLPSRVASTVFPGSSHDSSRTQQYEAQALPLGPNRLSFTPAQASMQKERQRQSSRQGRTSSSSERGGNHGETMKQKLACAYLQSSLRLLSRTDASHLQSIRLRPVSNRSSPRFFRSSTHPSTRFLPSASSFHLLFTILSTLSTAAATAASAPPVSAATAPPRLRLFRFLHLQRSQSFLFPTSSHLISYERA